MTTRLREGKVRLVPRISWTRALLIGAAVDSGRRQHRARPRAGRMVLVLVLMVWRAGRASRVTRGTQPLLAGSLIVSWRSPWKAWQPIDYWQVDVLMLALLVHLLEMRDISLQSVSLQRLTRPAWQTVSYCTAAQDDDADHHQGLKMTSGRELAVAPVARAISSAATWTLIGGA